MKEAEILGITTSLLAVWIFLILLGERFKPYRKGLPFFREGFWVDLVWYTIIQSYVLKIVIFDWIITPIQQGYSFTNLRLFDNVPIGLQVLFFLITHDFYIYWFHRFQHANKTLWRTHEAHHSGKQVDFLQGSRSHSLEILINQTIEFAPIILLGVHPSVLPIKAALDAMFGTFIHSNIDVKLGKWKYLFNSPELHLWHHANYQEVFHANFSTKFAIWDYLFGTVYDPAHKPENNDAKWGLNYAFPKDFFLQQIFLFKRIDEEKLMKHKWFRRYYHLRPTIISSFKRLIYAKRKNTEGADSE
jgi:sterol desaturase/sphingolipid hydroxylase (fatty acid hydroxylase superfamily)